jgi:molybdenum cofactor synthesis domain-containing protein
MARTAVVIISSTRAAAGVYPDSTGPVIVNWLQEREFEVADPVVVADVDVGPALSAALGADLVITSGGTGLSPTDRTPQATAAVLDYDIPGLAEAFRRHGAAGVPAAVLSRGLAGVAGRTLVINLPGSTGGVKDGLAVLGIVLDHALDQIAGGDHARPDTSHAVPADDPEGSRRP